MELTIYTHGFKLTDSLQDYIDERIGKLERYEDHVVDAKLEVRAFQYRSGGEQFSAQFTIAMPGRILRSEVRNRDERVAIDLAVEKIDRQFRRYHSRKLQRSKQNAVNLGRLAAQQAGVFDDLNDQSTNGTVVRTKKFELLPMDIEEAIEQLELLEHDFYMFRNRNDREINVIYRRHAGEYGLIQPDTP